MGEPARIGERRRGIPGCRHWFPTSCQQAALRLAAERPLAHHAERLAGLPDRALVGKAMQLHGGMGYTWESGIHVYLKRAALNRSLFGSPAAHRRRLAARYR